MIDKPTSINILGIVYKVEYVDKPSDVDIHRRESLWAQIDYWSRSIRVYDGEERPIQDTWVSILHEVLHGIASELKLEKSLGEKEEMEETVDLLALALVDVLVRNGWMEIE